MIFFPRLFRLQTILEKNRPELLVIVAISRPEQSLFLTVRGPKTANKKTAGIT